MNAPHGPPLARLLDTTAEVVAAVRGGRSLTDLLAKVPPELRPGVQALSFHALRWLGSAMGLREQLAPKPPPPNVDSLLLVALALLWPPGPGDAPPPYPEHTLVDQAVAAMRQRAPAVADRWSGSAIRHCPGMLMRSAKAPGRVMPTIVRFAQRLSRPCRQKSQRPQVISGLPVTRWPGNHSDEADSITVAANSWPSTSPGLRRGSWPW